MLPCASINTTLSWIPNYPYLSIGIPYPITYPTLPTVGKIPLLTLSIYPTFPINVTSAYIPVPTSHYLLLHTPTCISPPYIIATALLNIRPKRPTKLGRNDPGPKRLRPKRPKPKRHKTEMTQTKTTRQCSCGCRTCRNVYLIIWLSIFVRVRIFWTSYIFVIILFPYTHDTGAVTGMESGDEFYTLPLIER